MFLTSILSTHCAITSLGFNEDRTYVIAALRTEHPLPTMLVVKVWRTKIRTKPYSSNRIFSLLLPGLLIFSFVLKFRPHSEVVAWDYHSIQACSETSCLQTAPFSAYISFDEAAEAQGYLHTYLNKSATPTTTRLLQREPKVPQCSVIGGAPGSQQSAYVKLIDSAPVIRLNLRHPVLMAAEGISSSLGKRTDILIMQRKALRHFERYIHAWGQGNQTLSLQRRHAMETFKQSAPMLLYRSECPSRSKACPASLEMMVNSTAPTLMPFRLLHPDIEVAAKTALLPFNLSPNYVPSTGIVSIIAALRMCKRINLFAMSGSTKGDRDFANLTVWHGHELDGERQFIRWLATCHRFQSKSCGRLKVFP